MSDISERGESFHLKELQDLLFKNNHTILGVHLWTHSPVRFSRNVIVRHTLQAFREHCVPVTLEITITGLGGTFLEPGIETTEEAFSHIRELIDHNVLSPEKIGVRIDPLQAWEYEGRIVSNLAEVPDLMRRIEAAGIHRVRISQMNFHRYQTRISPRMLRMNLRYLTLDSSEIASQFRPWLYKGMKITTCAFDLTKEGIPPGACFDFTWITGLPISGKLLPVAQRGGCLCFYPQGVSLRKIPRRSSCSGRCVACYAQEHP